MGFHITRKGNPITCRAPRGSKCVFKGRHFEQLTEARDFFRQRFEVDYLDGPPDYVDEIRTRIAGTSLPENVSLTVNEFGELYAKLPYSHLADWKQFNGLWTPEAL